MLVERHGEFRTLMRQLHAENADEAGRDIQGGFGRWDPQRTLDLPYDRRHEIAVHNLDSHVS